MHTMHVHSTLEREERYPYPHPKQRNIPTIQTNKQTNKQLPDT